MYFSNICSGLQLTFVVWNQSLKCSEHFNVFFSDTKRRLHNRQEEKEYWLNHGLPKFFLDIYETQYIFVSKEKMKIPYGNMCLMSIICGKCNKLFVNDIEKIGIL